jgi:UDP-N-acetylmuramate-alanine ligase
MILLFLINAQNLFITHPKTAILNNLEFDHADIFDDLAAIQKQFHHLVRTIPSTGRIIVPANDTNLADTLAKAVGLLLKPQAFNRQQVIGKRNY